MYFSLVQSLKSIDKEMHMDTETDAVKQL